MREWILFFLIGLPLLAAVGSRWFMYRALSRVAFGGREFCGLLLAGAGKDLWPLALCLALRQAALLAGFLTFAGPLCWLLTGLAALLGVAVILLSLLDAGVYYNTRQRVFPLFLKEITPRKIAVALSPRLKIALAALLALLVGYAAVFFIVPPVSPASLAASCGPLVLLAGSALLFSRLELPASRYIESRTIGTLDQVRSQVGDKLAAIRSSSLANFAACLGERFFRKAVPLRREEYSRSERRSLEHLGLLGCGKYSDAPPRPQRYKRIILVLLESVSQRMLSFYNRELDASVTPFLNTLLAHSPRLDQLWTSNSPTDEGIYALHASRLGYEYDLKHGPGRIPSLSSLLREAGYATYALSGVTRHFGNKDVFFKRLLRYEHFLAEEDLCSRPDARYLGWGLADRVVYSAALDILQERRGQPVLLTVETANTHPPFYHSLYEESFPPAVAASSSRLLRALHEADLDLLYFYTQLQQRGLFDSETLLIVTADHSPNHGHECMKLFNLADFWPERIPFLCVTPDPAGNPLADIRKNIACCQLDLLPTLIEALGLPRSPSLEAVQGRSLYRGEDSPVIREFEGEMRVRHGQADLAVNLREGGERFDGLRKWYYNSLLGPYLS